MTGRDVAESLARRFAFADRDAETVAGLVINAAGRLQKPGEPFDVPPPGRQTAGARTPQG